MRLGVLEQSTIWLSAARSVSGGRACRDYVIYDHAGAPKLTAQTSPWQREIVVQTAAQPPQRFLLLRRRLTFPLTGRVDVYDERNARLGVVSRSGHYRDASGRSAGRFRDARTFGNRAREGALVGVLDALLGGDATVAEGGGPSAFLWLVGSEVTGTLGRAPLPFTSEGTAAVAARPPAPTSRRSALTKRLREFIGPARPQGWKLERLQAAPGDPRLTLAAALFAIELSHW